MKVTIVLLGLLLAPWCVNGETRDWSFLPEGWKMLGSSETAEEVNPGYTYLDDYFVLENEDATQRVAFIRWGEETRGKLLAHHLDSLNETSYDGNVPHLRSEKARVGTHYPINTELHPKEAPRVVTYTTITTTDTAGTNWLAHGMIWEARGSVYAVVHASTQVIGPEEIYEWRELLKPQLEEK